MSPPYTTSHYVLMAASVAVLVAFVGGILYLLIREKQKIILAKKEHIQTLLKRRRKAISAAPRGEVSAPPSPLSPLPPLPASSPAFPQAPQIQITTSFFSFPTRLVAGSQFIGKESIEPLQPRAGMRTLLSQFKQHYSGVCCIIHRTAFSLGRQICQRHTALALKALEPINDTHLKAPNSNALAQKRTSLHYLPCRTLI